MCHFGPTISPMRLYANPPRRFGVRLVCVFVCHAYGRVDLIRAPRIGIRTFVFIAAFVDNFLLVVFRDFPAKPSQCFIALFSFLFIHIIPPRWPSFFLVLHVVKRARWLFRALLIWA